MAGAGAGVAGQGKPAGGERRLFYGYWIIAATFVIQMLVNGCGMYAFSLFVKPLELAFGWKRAGIMLSLVVYNLVTAATSPVVGRIVDRYGSRRVMAAGALVMGGGLAALSRASQLWQYNAAWGMVGCGVCATGFIPTTALLFKWFKRRRGLAIGIMGAGIGTGGFVMSPLIGGVLIPRLGWQGALVALGVLVAGVCSPLALLVVRSDPSELGQHVDGMAPEEVPAGDSSAAQAKRRGSAQGLQGVTLAEATRLPAFWLTALSFMLFSFAMNAIFQNQVPHLQDIGFPVAAAASALSAVGIGSALGKLGFGWVCDWLKPRYVFTFGVLVQLASVIILINIQASSPLSLVWTFAVLYGIGIGCWPIMSMVVSDTFGLAHYGAIYGALNLIHMLGGSVGAPFAGYIHDTAGSYHLAFIVFAVSFALAVPAIVLSGRARVGNTLPDGIGVALQRNQD